MRKSGFEIVIQPPHVRASELLMEHCAGVFSTVPGGPCAPRFLYLVPTRRKAEHIRGLLLERFHGLLFGNCVMTLSDFFESVNTASGALLTPLTDAARLALVEDVLRDMRQHLQFINHAAGYPGLVRKIGTLFSEFKQNNIFRIQDLRDSLENETARRAVPAGKAHDLTLLFDEYLRRLAALGEHGERVPDAEDAQFLAGRALGSQGFSALFPHAACLVLDGFYDFNSLQQFVLRQAIATAPTSVAALEMEPAPAPDMPGAWRWSRVFALPNRTLDFYRTCRDDVHETVLNGGDDPQCMRRVGGRLFRSAGGPDGLEHASDVLLISPRDQRAEVVEMARRIKRLAMGGDAQTLARIAVVFPALENYELLVREEFLRHGIPCQISAGRPLSSSPVCSAISAMLDAARSGFPRSVLFRFLASPFVRMPHAGDAAAPDAFEMDLMARDAQITGGSGAADWRNAFQDYRTRLARRVSTDAQKLDRVDAVAACFDAVLKRLEPLRDPAAPMAPDVFAQNIRTLIHDFGMRELVCAHPHSGVLPWETRRNIRALQAFENVLQELESGLSLLSRGGGAAERPVGELMDMLRTALVNTRFTGGARVGGGVHVMGLLETRGLDFDVVFLGGLLNDAFPKKDEVAFFLDPGERRAARLESIRADISEDRFLFYRLFQCTHRQLVISWPARTEERDNVPSLFVDELRRHIPVQDNASLLTEDSSQFYCRDDACEGFGSEVAGDHAMAREFAAALDPVEMRFIAHNMDVEWERRFEPLQSVFHGRITAPPFLRLLQAAWDPPHNTLGVTALESYTRCPFRFFVTRVLDIEAIEEVEEDITAMDRGTLLHSVVEQFYRERYDDLQGLIVPVPPDGAGRDAAERRMVDIAEKLLAAMRFSGVFWEAWRDSLLAGLSGYAPARADHAPGVLKAFLDYECRDPDWFMPRFLESSFDNAQTVRDACDTRIQASALEIILDTNRTFYIKGKVDRIDIAKGGQPLFFVVDYKSYAGKPGVTPSAFFDAVNTGRDFQLPVYLLMAGRALGTDWKAAGATLYALSGISKFTGKTVFFASEDFHDPKAEGGNAINTGVKKGFVPGEAFDEILGARVEQNIRAALQAMHLGYFNPDILDAKRATCEYCELSRVCRAQDSDAEHLQKLAEGLPGIYRPKPYVAD